MRRPNRRRRGFNLLEVVVAIAIITMLSSAVGVYAIARYRDSRVDVARTELETLEGQLDAYLALTGHYPEPSKGFGPLVERRLVKELPVDPWGQPFTWRLVNGVPVVTSLGEDGAEGGEGYDADLHSDASAARSRQAAR
ncbi:MAG: type II secretion system protein GspG [Myxococcaceae bacterium]|jgi:general secretion pathway protein G|nr:type II secretion system protein GspG [Myxococcaceae bacterium]